MSIAAIVLTVLGLFCQVGAAVWLRRKRYNFTVGFNGEQPGLEALNRDTNNATGLVLIGAALQTLGAVLSVV